MIAGAGPLLSAIYTGRRGWRVPDGIWCFPVTPLSQIHDQCLKNLTLTPAKETTLVGQRETDGTPKNADWQIGLALLGFWACRAIICATGVRRFRRGFPFTWIFFRAARTDTLSPKSWLANLVRSFSPWFFELTSGNPQFEG